jgi:protein-disulfide isomerase
MANGVDATPTFFISGRRYQAELETMQMIDVLEEEYERSSSAQSR